MNTPTSSLTNLFSRRGVLLWVGFFSLMWVYHLIYGQFFPGRSGMMGHDWTHVGAIPYYINEYQLHGLSLWKVFFNPGGCQSLISVGPGFPLTIEEWLIFAQASPLQAVYVPFLVFAALGFWGMYLLLRGTFRLGAVVAFLGAGLFLFNEFYAARIIIGHGYLAVMLIPLTVWLLTKPPVPNRSDALDIACGVLAGMVLFVAWLQGLMAIVVTVALSMAVLLLLALIEGAAVRVVALRCALALVVAIGWSWWSLTQSIFTESFESAIAQRQSYSLQGFVTLWDTLKMLALTVFYGPGDIEQRYSSVITNLSIYQGRHELEYGVGPAVLLLLLMGAVYGVMAWLNRSSFFDAAWWRRNALWLVLLLLLLLFPILYATYSPLTNSLWKKLPLISATTSPQRTFFVYGVFFIVWLAILVQRYFPTRSLPAVAAVALLLTIGATAVKDRAYYHDQPFDPKPAMDSYARLRAGQPLPPIESIGVLTDASGRPTRNQMMEANLYLQGVQSMGCYIPSYSSVPVELVKQLRPGSVWLEQGDSFNIKNPACNTWPKENGCAPGDHFKVSQRKWVEQYTHYQPFPVVVPQRLIVAGWVSGVSVLLTLLFLGWVAVSCWRRKTKG